MEVKVTSTVKALDVKAKEKGIPAGAANTSNPVRTSLKMRMGVLSLCWLVALSCPLRAAGDGQVEIVETQLPAYSAAIGKVDSSGVAVKLAGESRVVPFDQLLRARFSRATTKVNAAEKVTVELSDGSSTRCAEVTSDGKTVKLLWADGHSAMIPARQVSSCLLQPLDEARASQWEAIVESRVSSDVLVIQRTPESLDRIEGVIGEVSASSVKFQFDGQSIDVARTKLAGWRYFSASASSSRPKVLAVVHDEHNSSWMVQSISGDWTQGNSTVKLKLVCHVDIELPLSSITEIDFSFGSMRFLADLEPLERKVQPRLKLAINLPEAEQLFGPRPAAADSQRGATVGPGLEFLGSGSIVFRVPNDFRRLLGTVALTPDGPQFVPCKVQVFIEDKIAWEKTLESPQDVFPVDIAVEPGKRLRVIVQAESPQPVGDHVTWRQLRFVK